MFGSSYSQSDVELSLPSTVTVANLTWVGVCANNSASTVLASVVIAPQLVANVPCETTLLGVFPMGTSGVAGRVYLLDRETFAVIGFRINMTSGMIIM